MNCAFDIVIVILAVVLIFAIIIAIKLYRNSKRRASTCYADVGGHDEEHIARADGGYVPYYEKYEGSAIVVATEEKDAI